MGPGPLVGGARAQGPSSCRYIFVRQHLEQITNLGSKRYPQKVEIRPPGPLQRARDRNSVQKAGPNASRCFFPTNFVKIWVHLGWIGVPGPACMVLGQFTGIQSEFRRISVEFSRNSLEFSRSTRGKAMSASAAQTSLPHTPGVRMT